MGVEPIPGEPAAVATCDGERALVVADYHAGIEAGLRRDGVELPDHAPDRRESLRALVEDADLVATRLERELDVRVTIEVERCRFTRYRLAPVEVVR